MTTCLWQPSEERKETANITRFMSLVGFKHKKHIASYDALYEWSISDIPSFWDTLWEFGSVKASVGPAAIIDDPDKMPGARWFVGAKLNFAENLLRFRDERCAIISKVEDREPVRISYAEVYRAVSDLARALRQLGVSKGDRVVGYMPNVCETVFAMLAATSVGAVWSSCSPDFGVGSVIDRFRQIEPTVLFTVDGYVFRGKEINLIERLSSIADQLPCLKKIVICPLLRNEAVISGIPRTILYRDFIIEHNGEVEFEQVPFEHPVYIMYSSGTTGLPKCIVQSAGGVLLQHLKELVLHTNLKREDKIFYYTTCGWMMWNWLVSSLSAGATLMLYDGSPFYPELGSLMQWAEDEGISIFGTSARYLYSIEKEGLRPGRDYDLTTLKTILSTGSPLSVSSFNYVYEEIKQDVQLASISGGTEINGCFALGNPLGAVYAGELQCRGLGMKVEAFDESGKSVSRQRGELVCTAPFPSMPIGFWNDPGERLYKKSYFEKYPNVWAHGDYIEITERGGVIIYGRSDATLNPGGVRIGTSEIYRQVESVPEVLDSLAVAQKFCGHERVILFVKLSEGIQLTEELRSKIRIVIRENLSPRHVPAKIVQVPEIPYTINQKKVELTVRNVINGDPVTNRDALSNPEVLKYYEDIPELAT